MLCCGLCFLPFFVDWPFLTWWPLLYFLLPHVSFCYSFSTLFFQFPLFPSVCFGVLENLFSLWLAWYTYRFGILQKSDQWMFFRVEEINTLSRIWHTLQKLRGIGVAWFYFLEPGLEADFLVARCVALERLLIRESSMHRKLQKLKWPINNVSKFSLYIIYLLCENLLNYFKVFFFIII